MAHEIIGLVFGELLSRDTVRGADGLRLEAPATSRRPFPLIFQAY